MTGLSFETVQAARCWNALAPQFPHFEDGAQMMLTMSNGCGMLADVSYFMPSKGGYSLPYYWRTTLYGSSGIAEVSSPSGLIDITRDGSVVSVEPVGPQPEGYLDHCCMNTVTRLPVPPAIRSMMGQTPAATI